MMQINHQFLINEKIKLNKQIALINKAHCIETTNVRVMTC